MYAYEMCAQGVRRLPSFLAGDGQTVLAIETKASMVEEREKQNNSCLTLADAPTRTARCAQHRWETTHTHVVLCTIWGKKGTMPYMRRDSVPADAAPQRG